MTLPTEIEKPPPQPVEEQIRKLGELVDMLYNMIYGMAIKIDMLSSIVMQTLDTLDPLINRKITDPSNLEAIAETAKARVQRQLDMMAFGNKADTAPLDQLMADRTESNDP